MITMMKVMYGYMTVGGRGDKVEQESLYLLVFASLWFSYLEDDVSPLMSLGILFVFCFLFCFFFFLHVSFIKFSLPLRGDQGGTRSINFVEDWG